MHGALHKLRGWGRLGFGTASTDRGWLLGSLLQDSRASLLLGYRSNLVREVDLKTVNGRKRIELSIDRSFVLTFVILLNVSKFPDCKSATVIATRKIELNAISYQTQPVWYE